MTVIIAQRHCEDISKQYFIQYCQVMITIIAAAACKYTGVHRPLCLTLVTKTLLVSRLGWPVR